MQRRRRGQRPVAGLVLGLLIVVLVTLALLPFGDLSRAAPAVVLVVPVVLAGAVGGWTAAIATSVAAALAFSLAFIPPVGTLRVAVATDAVALAVFTLVAAALGILVSVEANRRRAAELRADEIAAMHSRYEALVGEQQRLKEEADRVTVLEHIDEQRSALLRSVSHDLRTPLASIRAVATDLRAGADHSPSVREELLDMVCDEVERLDRLVANLLSLSRIEAGALHPDRQAVALQEMVADLVKRLSRVLGDVRLDVQVPPSLPLVDVDYVQMDQVLTNLLENAARHSPSGSTIEVAAKMCDGAVEITVTDHGRGITSADRPHVFEPFQTSNGSTSTGIGLAICKAIVDAHGGTITVEDTPLGGALFRFTVPVRHGER